MDCLDLSYDGCKKRWYKSFMKSWKYNGQTTHWSSHRVWWKFDHSSSIMCLRNHGQYRSNFLANAEEKGAYTVADPRFPPGGGVNHPRWVWFCQSLPKTAWNWKNLDAQGGGGGGVRPHAPLRSANAIACNTSQRYRQSTKTIYLFFSLAIDRCGATF